MGELEVGIEKTGYGNSVNASQNPNQEYWTIKDIVFHNEMQMSHDGHPISSATGTLHDAPYHTRAFDEWLVWWPWVNPWLPPLGGYPDEIVLSGGTAGINTSPLKSFDFEFTATQLSPDKDSVKASYASVDCIITFKGLKHCTAWVPLHVDGVGPNVPYTKCVERTVVMYLYAKRGTRGNVAYGSSIEHQIFPPWDHEPF
jgi:hypothetical protein